MCYLGHSVSTNSELPGLSLLNTGCQAKALPLAGGRTVLPLQETFTIFSCLFFKLGWPKSLVGVFLIYNIFLNLIGGATGTRLKGGVVSQKQTQGGGDLIFKTLLSMKLTVPLVLT